MEGCKDESGQSVRKVAAAATTKKIPSVRGRAHGISALHCRSVENINMPFATERKSLCNLANNSFQQHIFNYLQYKTKAIYDFSQGKNARDFSCGKLTRK